MAVGPTLPIPAMLQLQVQLFLLPCLFHLADELERRNMGEEELRQQMTEAVKAAEQEAHRRVEEGYREASQAVSKAL